MRPLHLFAIMTVSVPVVVASTADAATGWTAKEAFAHSVVDTNGIRWVDGRYLPLEGRPFANTDGYYERLPSTVTTNVNAGARAMRKHTSGMQIRFATDSRHVYIKWKNSGSDMWHMPATGVSGIDVYKRDAATGDWRFFRIGAPKKNAKEPHIMDFWEGGPGAAYLVNLPLYNEIEEFSVGIAKHATLEALGPRASGIEKPVVFYGTSITHGGCASRPGTSFVNLIGRDLDVPVVDLGFSGCGWMEFEMSEHLAKIDASCYVLDCLGNMTSLKDAEPKAGRNVEENYEPFIRNLRTKRPGVPIVMAEKPSVHYVKGCHVDRYLRSLYEKLVAEGWNDLVYLPRERMHSFDAEDSVDGAHPSDLGMRHYADGYGFAVKCALDRTVSDIPRVSVPESDGWEPSWDTSGADTNGLVWIDGRKLPLEGRAFAPTKDEFYYYRIPDDLSTNVNSGVRNMRSNTAGMQFRFRTDSRRLVFRWTNTASSMQHMCRNGASGIDVYYFDETRGKWMYAHTGIPSRDGSCLAVPDWHPGAACLVNLPLYNGVKAFSVGVDPGAKVTPLGPRASGVEKPVVFYGTSITQGACASRPGMAFVNIVGRELDVPVVNLGFSGSGVMEYAMSDVLARIDASCYVLDCLWNMRSAKDAYGKRDRDVEDRYEPFIRNLRLKRPGVPIVMAEQCDVFLDGPCNKDLFIRGLYEKLIAEGWGNLYYLPKDRMYSGDGEGTVDRCHPTDRGMVQLAAAFGGVVKKALGDSLSNK